MMHSIYIEPSLNNKLLDFKISLVKYGSEIRKALKLHVQHTFFISNLNKDLARLFVMTEGIKAIVINNDFPMDNIKEEHEKSKKSLMHFRSSYSKLEKNRFFKNSNTRKLSNNTLTNFYTIEYKLRTKAYAIYDNSADQDLLKYASSLSLSSLNLAEDDALSTERCS